MTEHKARNVSMPKGRPTGPLPIWRGWVKLRSYF